MFLLHCTELGERSWIRPGMHASAISDPQLSSHPDGTGTSRVCCCVWLQLPQESISRLVTALRHNMQHHNVHSGDGGHGNKANSRSFYFSNLSSSLAMVASNTQPLQDFYSFKRETELFVEFFCSFSLDLAVTDQWSML